MDVEPLGQLGAQGWPNHWRPVQVEVVDHLQYGGVPDHHQGLSPTEAAQDHAQALTQGVHTINVLKGLNTSNFELPMVLRCVCVCFLFFFRPYII